MESSKLFSFTHLKEHYDYLAPDTSEIRLLESLPSGGICHCKLPPQRTSIAVYHITVNEIWYVLSGVGEMWQKYDERESITALLSELSITIPTGNKFQFRNTGSDDLCILITTMPHWPGADEAVPTEGKWQPSIK